MVEFDKKGNPLLSISSNKVVMLTTEESVPVISSNKEVDPVTVGKFKAIPWYDDNDFPQKADETITGTSVLKRTIGDLTKVTLGQGIYPCTIDDILPNGQEKQTLIKDPLLTNQLQGYVIRRYLAKSCYDLHSYGSYFVQFIPNIEGTKILKLNPVNSLKCRLEMFDNKGNINNVLISGKWPDAEANDIQSYMLLDEIDPFEHLNILKEEGALKNNTVFMQVKNDFSSNDFYPMPDWYSAKPWIDITQKVPKIINAGIDNVLNIFFLIKIPASYWNWKYPEDEFDTAKERRDRIQADITKLENEFTSVENAKKALITHFGINEGDNEDKWDIEILQPKFSQENFVTSNAADTQIAIAGGYSPDLLGLMYGNSKGGSMQRELLLLQYALSWNTRQKLADPIEMMLKFNGADENLQLRFRNTFLTTLDTGSGTGSQLS